MLPRFQMPTMRRRGGAVSQGYRDLILADGPLAYWRLGETSGLLGSDEIGANPLSYTSTGISYATPGAINGDADTALTFDGASGAASVLLPLGAYSAVTLEFWIKVASWNNSDRLAMEYTSNFNGTAGGILVDPNASGGGWDVAIQESGNYNIITFARPSTGAWHHVALVFDLAAPPSTLITPYLDGAAIAYSKSGNSAIGAFANDRLFIASRNASSLLLEGSLDEVAVFGSALTPAQILAHYNKGIGL